MRKGSQSKSLYKREEEKFSFSRFLNTELSFKQLVIIFSVVFLVLFLVLKNNIALIFILVILTMLFFLLKFLVSFVKSLRGNRYDQFNTFESHDFEVNFQDSIDDFQDESSDDGLYSLNDLSRNQDRRDKK